jgi:hypothetical protein
LGLGFGNRRRVCASVVIGIVGGLPVVAARAAPARALAAAATTLQSGDSRTTLHVKLAAHARGRERAALIRALRAGGAHVASVAPGATGALDRYLVVRARPGTDLATLADTLNRLDLVELAEPAPEPAPLPTPSYVARQRYRAAARAGGLDVDYARTLPGGRGENVRVVDIEYSWNRAHEDLSKTRAEGSKISVGTPVDPYRNNNHGTAVLGVIGGDGNGFGVTGIAARAKLSTVNAVSVEHGYNLARAVATATQHLEAGDVILLEQQTYGPHGCGAAQVGCVAPEWDNTVYDAIRVATAAGIIVVEPAGNGRQNLDRPEYGVRFPKGKADSGAILVGAGRPPNCPDGAGIPTRGRMPFSNYGRRVDLQAWGGCVVSTGRGDLQNRTNATYTSSFAGTSSAAAIVAGAAAVLSSVAQELDVSLTPAQLRALLVRTGTAEAADGYHIGPLPNLRTAIDGLTTGTKATVRGPFHLVSKLDPVTDSIPVEQYWSATHTSGIAESRLWMAANGGAWERVPLASPAARSAVVRLRPGSKYVFALAIRAGNGTWTRFQFDAPSRPYVFEETKASFSAGWQHERRAAETGYVKTTAVAGARASITFTGRNAAWIATKGPGRGQVDVYVDGKRVARIDLEAPTIIPATAAWTARWDRKAARTIAVVATGDGPVDVDAFVRA